MNSQFIISNKITCHENEHPSESQKFSFINLPLNHIEGQRYLIPEKKKDIKPRHFINMRNVTTIKTFNKININNSAPNLLIVKNHKIKNQPEILKKQPSENHEEKFCKICFEPKSNKTMGKLIAPCNCSGTVKYIHEECLKTWLVSQNIDLKYASCELCNNSYKMEIKIGLKFLPQQVCKQGLQNLLALICLIIFLGCLLVIIVMFSLQW